MNEPSVQTDLEAPGRPWPTDAHDPGTFRLVEETESAPGRVVTPSGTVRFLNVSGTHEEMGRQTGRLLADVIPEGPVPFYTTFLSRILASAGPGNAQNVIRWATDRFSTDRLVDAFQGDLRRCVEALAETTPLATRSFLEAYTLPEALLWLAGTADRFVGTDRIPGLGRLVLGACTSAVVRPPASEGLLHGYNFDFFGVGAWEPAATVQFYHPDDGLDYVAAASAGVVGGGRTAMNAAGLTLSTHQHAVDHLDFEGTPVGIAGDRAMRRARNIDEAVEILRDTPPVAGWSYVLTEGDTGASALYEVAPNRESLHRLPDEQPQFGHTNLYRDDALAELEIDGPPEYRRTLRARDTRVRELTADLADASEVDPRSIAAILGDFVDPSGNRERLVGRTIASVRNISSVVFEPGERRIWVGSGSSPVSRSWFVPFEMAARRESDGGGPVEDATPFHPLPGWSREPHGQAFRLYRDACIRALEDESDKRLLILIEHALALYPRDPSLHMLGGLLAVRMGRPRRAEGAFRRALERLNELPRRAEATLYLAWALDLQEQRSSARQMYREVLHMQSADPAVARRARTGRWVSFSEKKARKLAIDFVRVSAV